MNVLLILLVRSQGEVLSLLRKFPKEVFSEPQFATWKTYFDLKESSQY